MSGRTRRRAVFNDNLEEELGDDDDDDEDEDGDCIDEDNEEDFEEIKLRSINPQVQLIFCCYFFLSSLNRSVFRIWRKKP